MDDNHAVACNTTSIGCESKLIKSCIDEVKLPSSEKKCKQKTADSADHPSVLSFTS